MKMENKTKTFNSNTKKDKQILHRRKIIKLDGWSDTTENPKSKPKPITPQTKPQTPLSKFDGGKKDKTEEIAFEDKIYQAGREDARKELVEDILDWCYKNNMIKFKNMAYRLAVTDGGWVNVIELKKFMEEKIK